MAEYLSWLEDPAHTRGVVGSSPTSATMFSLLSRSRSNSLSLTGHRGFKNGQIIAPYLVFYSIHELGEADKRHVLRFFRLLSESIVELRKGFIALFGVALLAAGNEIIPGVAASEPAWNDMIDRQIAALMAAVLACIMVTCEYASSGELYLRHGPSDMGSQPDDRW